MNLVTQNTQNYDTAYNAKTGVSVKLGESEESVKNKFSTSEYEIIPFINIYEQADSLGRYRYEFTEYESTNFGIAITDGKVSGLGLYPATYPDVYIFCFRIPPKKLKSDWYFKNGVTVGAKPETVNQCFGIPSWPRSGNVTDEEYELFEEHGTAHTSIYAFNEDSSYLTVNEYEANRNGDTRFSPTCYARLCFARGKLDSVIIRYGGDPQDLPGRGSNNYYDHLVGTP